ncbi:MAG: hypothetical protein AVO39_10280 [delta proteobacterium MLS_D]|jgi:hypothetical protein|nr:MAG: hypothetical protein AVO39_10280 [delta proteobacterium MLS_D]
MTLEDVGIIEGRAAILRFFGVASWNTIRLRRANDPGFGMLFHRNPANGRPFIVANEAAQWMIRAGKKPRPARGHSR